jgi:hypothetical protein
MKTRNEENEGASEKGCFTGRGHVLILFMIKKRINTKMMKLKVNEDADDDHYQINNVLFSLNRTYY